MFPQLCPSGARFADFAFADRVFFLKQPRSELTKLGRELQRGRRIQDRFMPSHLTLPELSSTPASNSSPNAFRGALALAHCESIASAQPAADHRRLTRRAGVGLDREFRY
jgi:hypothetical protein